MTVKSQQAFAFSYRAARGRPAWLVPVLGVAGAVVAATVATALVVGAVSHAPAVKARPAPLTAAQLDAREASAGPTGSPLLWVVHNGKATVYLFGSIHVLKGNTTWMDPRLFQAFDTADEAWFEVPDLDKLPPFTGFKQSAMANKPVLLAGLTDAEKTELATIVNRYNATLDDVARVKPGVMAGFINALDRMGGGFTTDSGVDYTLFHRARSLKIKTDGFEPNKLHYSYLTELGNQPTAADYGTTALKKALTVHFGVGGPDEGIQNQVKNWRNGDEKVMTASLKQEDVDNPAVNQILLVKRNRLWVPRIEEMLKGDKTVFITVGTNHLFGPEGLVSRLRGLGYTVDRIDPKT